MAHMNHAGEDEVLKAPENGACETNEAWGYLEGTHQQSVFEGN